MSLVGNTAKTLDEKYDNILIDNIVTRMRVCAPGCRSVEVLNHTQGEGHNNDNTSSPSDPTPNPENRVFDDQCPCCSFPKIIKRSAYLYHRYLCPCDVDVMIDTEKSTNWLKKSAELFAKKRAVPEGLSMYKEDETNETGSGKFQEAKKRNSTTKSDIAKYHPESLEEFCLATNKDFKNVMFALCLAVSKNVSSEMAPLEQDLESHFVNIGLESKMNETESLQYHEKDIPSQDHRGTESCPLRLIAVETGAENKNNSSTSSNCSGQDCQINHLNCFDESLISIGSDTQNHLTTATLKFNSGNREDIIHIDKSYGYLGESSPELPRAYQNQYPLRDNQCFKLRDCHFLPYGLKPCFKTHQSNQRRQSCYVKSYDLNVSRPSCGNNCHSNKHERHKIIRNCCKGRGQRRCCLRPYIQRRKVCFQRPRFIHRNFERQLRGQIVNQSQNLGCQTLNGFHNYKRGLDTRYGEKRDASYMPLTLRYIRTPRPGFVHEPAHRISTTRTQTFQRYQEYPNNVPKKSVLNLDARNNSCLQASSSIHNAAMPYFLHDNTRKKECECNIKMCPLPVPDAFLDEKRLNCNRESIYRYAGNSEENFNFSFSAPSKVFTPTNGHAALDKSISLVCGSSKDSSEHFGNQNFDKQSDSLRQVDIVSGREQLSCYSKQFPKPHNMILPPNHVSSLEVLKYRTNLLKMNQKTTTNKDIPYPNTRTCSINECEITSQNNNNDYPQHVNNNSCNYSTAAPERVQMAGRVVRVEGDGRCLFRSLAVAEHEPLQSSARDEFGRSLSRVLADRETNRADELRAEVVWLMSDNMHFYSQLEKGVLNADQPAPSSYQRFRDRLTAMSHPTTMPGDLELNAVTLVMEKQIVVLDTNMAVITTYGRDRFPLSSPLAVRYTRLVADVGHYDAVLLDQKMSRLNSDGGSFGGMMEWSSSNSGGKDSGGGGSGGGLGRKQSVPSGLCGDFQKLSTSGSSKEEGSSVDPANASTSQRGGGGDTRLNAKKEFFYLRDTDKILHSDGLLPLNTKHAQWKGPKTAHATTSTVRARVCWPPTQRCVVRRCGRARKKAVRFSDKHTQTDVEAMVELEAHEMSFWAKRFKLAQKKRCSCRYGNCRERRYRCNKTRPAKCRFDKKVRQRIEGSTKFQNINWNRPTRDVGSNGYARKVVVGGNVSAQPTNKHGGFFNQSGTNGRVVCKERNKHVHYFAKHECNDSTTAPGFRTRPMVERLCTKNKRASELINDRVMEEYTQECFRGGYTFKPKTTQHITVGNKKKNTPTRYICVCSPSKKTRPGIPEVPQERLQNRLRTLKRKPRPGKLRPVRVNRKKNEQPPPFPAKNQRSPQIFVRDRFCLPASTTFEPVLCRCVLCNSKVEALRRDSVQCYLCGRVAHRMCVMKDSPSVSHSGGDSNYFLCPYCVPV